MCGREGPAVLGSCPWTVRCGTGFSAWVSVPGRNLGVWVLRRLSRPVFSRLSDSRVRREISEERVAVSLLMKTFAAVQTIPLKD